MRILLLLLCLIGLDSAAQTNKKTVLYGSNKDTIYIGKPYLITTKSKKAQVSVSGCGATKKFEDGKQFILVSDTGVVTIDISENGNIYDKPLKYYVKR